MTQLYLILKDIIFPIFVLVCAGIFLEKRFKLDIGTMSKLNFYIFVPALLFKALTEATLDLKRLIMVAVFQITLIFLLLLLNFGAKRLLRLGAGLGSAYLLATVFCNSGNFGIPLVSLVWPDSESLVVSYQAIQVMVQNLSTFTLGLIIVGHGRTTVAQSLAGTLKLPFVYVITAALLLKQFQVPVMEWVWLWSPIKYAGNGLVAVALITLGVQIAKTPRISHVKALAAANVMRLVAAPVAAFALVKLFIYLGTPGFDGLLGQVLVIAAAAPSAVNTVLIGLEFKNEPDFAASAVFYSTFFCGFTVALTIFIVRNFM